MAIGARWNATLQEQHAWPAGATPLERVDERWARAVDVDAPAPTVFRWLCQMRVAPYSYDWVDNLGRQSPQELTPGLEQLSAGDRFLIVLRLNRYDPGRWLELTTSGRLVQMAMLYAVTPRDADRARLTLHIAVRAPRPVLAPLRVGDLVMARRQLLNLKGLAERDAQEARPAA